MISTIIESLNYQKEVLTEIPSDLQCLLNKVKLKHYDELYEEYDDITSSLTDDLTEVLKKFANGNKSINHIRYIWMTLIISLAVEPTLEYYDPNNNLPLNVIKLMESFFSYQLTLVNGSSKSINPNRLNQLINEIFKSHESYFHRKEANFQAISEALDVFYNAIRVLDYNQSVEAIVEILEDCLEGYAIFPGSYGRRELFDWWLLDVVPTSYKLLPPTMFYVVEGVKNKEEIRSRQTRLLAKISKRIRSYLPELILEFKQYNNYIFPTPGKINRAALKNSGKIQYQSKSPQLAYS
ncbi:hypothetical protein H5968_10520 [Sphaerospermopsis sp. LEGE 00249]|uniref:hypothetical protein n=1 Tax=Sphaerospermopsis sp. LEGE 00249 TaxID=1380707 RepID=UPI00164CDF7B|nr:hypothetical protein [Sphaerospermopsis sp. LEGE 00249]MBC5795570.1 hypothetical protein [Sphaerospermopsis sp. LEGE 00249]